MNNNCKHYAYYFFIPCYFYTDDNTLEGRNKLYDLLLPLFTWIEGVGIFLCDLLLDEDYEPTFKIKIGNKVK